MVCHLRWVITFSVPVVVKPTARALHFCFAFVIVRCVVVMMTGACTRATVDAVDGAVSVWQQAGIIAC